MTLPRIARGPLGYAGALLAGCASAAVFAVALARAETLLIMLAYLTAIPIFVAGLGAGSIAGLAASAAGTVGLYLTAPSNIAVIYAFVFAIPAITLTALALRYRVGDNQQVVWYPEGKLLTAIVIYPCIIFLAMVDLASGHPGGLLALTTDAFREIADKISAQLPSEQAVMLHSLMDQAAIVAPALIGWTWAIVMIIGMGVAQSALQKQGWNLRDRFSLRELRVPNWLIYVVALTGLVGVFAPAPYGYVGENIAIILGLPFFAVGLAIAHAAAPHTKLPTLCLIVFYLLLSVFAKLALIVAIVGVVDQWADFRKRLDPPPTPV